MEEALNDYKQMDTEMSVTPVPAPAAISKNVQVGMPKNIVLDSE